MPQNNFEINSIYPSQTPKPRIGGKIILTLLVILVAIIVYLIMSVGKTAKAPIGTTDTQAPAPINSALVEDLDASVGAALDTNADAADISAIQGEFK